MFALIGLFLIPYSVHGRDEQRKNVNGFYFNSMDDNKKTKL